MKHIYLKSIKPNWKQIKPFVGINYFKFTTKPDKNSLLFSLNNSDDFKVSYNNLKIDTYNNNIPSRSRKFCHYKINIKNENDYLVSLVDNNKFKQNAEDFRKNERVFKLMDVKFITSDWLLKFVVNLTALSFENEILKNEISKKYCNVYVHQVRQMVTKNNISHNSPEGIHRDGCDYIVSAYIVNKFNVQGSNSIIYDENKKKIYDTILNENEGIYQEDKKLYHYVDEIKTMDDNYIGYRDILGFDIQFE
jgi:hypothetical protein